MEKKLRNLVLMVFLSLLLIASIFVFSFSQNSMAEKKIIQSNENHPQKINVNFNVNTEVKKSDIINKNG